MEGPRRLVAATYSEAGGEVPGPASALTAYCRPRGASVSATYTYDGDGLRADLVWDRSSDIPEVVNDGLAFYLTGPGGVPVERVDAVGNAMYYHQDQLGSTRVLTDPTGRIAVSYSYDSYGNSTASTSAIANPFQFAGQFKDPQSGLMYMRARWYD